MSYTPPTLVTIYQRVIADMESRLTNGLKIPRVSLLGIVATGIAGASHLTYGFLKWMYRQIFIDTSDENGLTRHGNLYDVPRKEPSYTTGYVAFTGTASYTVPAGTLVANGEGYEYATQADFTIGDASVEVVAEEEGASGNTEETTLSLSVADPDVSSEVTVVSGFDDGRDLETLEDWVLRLLQRTQSPPSSGNAGDYVRWAQSVTGVDKAWCIPLYLGGGTVGVVVGTSDLQAVGSAILANVETYIEEAKPVPAAVTYMDLIPVDTDYEISITPNTVELRQLVRAKLDELHRLESGPGYTLLLSHIRAAISSAGVDDYEITDIRVDSVSIGINNITSTVPQAPVFNTATFATL